MSDPLHGQIPLSGTAQPLTSQQMGSLGVITIKAPLTNTNPAYIGASGVTTSNGHQLDPGDEMTYQYLSPNLATKGFDITPDRMFVVGTSPDKITWFASP